MDWLDFSLKFSGEALVLGITIMVVGFNFYFFSFAQYSDNSHLAQFLNYHSELNPKLNAKNNTIKTIILADGLISQAQADNFVGLSADNAQLLDTDTVQDSASSEGVLAAPSPDNIKASVVSVTKKIYTTVAGDTLNSLAKANGVSINSIKWSNPALVGDQLKPGWSLIIPPLDGIAVTADANTTLPDLATKYNPQRYNPDKKTRDASAAALLETIISYNGLDSAEDINPGDFLIVPDGVIAQAPAPPAPKPKPKAPVPDNSINDITSVSSGYDDVNHVFPKGYCTYYVASKMKITFGGNAKNWLANAQASGYVVKGPKEPAARTAVVMTGSKGQIRRYGHVAYVESVTDTTITISEMNYVRFNKVNTRTLSINDPSIRGYIYP